MFVHMSIHYPIEGKEQLLTESMHGFGEALKGLPGHHPGKVLEDEATGRLIGLAVWDSGVQWGATMPLTREAVKDDPFEDWEIRPPEVFHLESE